MSFDSILIAIGLVFAVTGFIGCILPVIPGPPLSYVSLLILSMAKEWEPFSFNFLLVMGVLTVVVGLSDYIIPAAGARRYGGTKFGFWGSILGMLFGMIFFSFLGLVVGGWVGAIAGELYAGKTGHEAFRAGWGVLVGNIAAVLIKMLLSGIILFYYVKGMF
jgi:uncharacterized protein YqgC (DUF456 family)